MSRISTPATIDAAPAASRPLLEGAKKQLGVVPNMFRLIANSPGTLESYLGLSAALNKGALPAATRERIALAVAEVNGCNYCLSAHTYLGKNLAKLDDAEIAANRNGASSDPKADAAIRFAVKVVRERGPSAKACTRQQRLDWLPEEAFATAFAQNASADDRAVLAAVQRPISLGCITVPVGRPLWKDIPSWFLVAEDDRMIVPETQRYMAERMKAKIKAHAVDHTPSVTAPRVVVDIIRDAIRSITDN
jgi:AhpD family alkylhydroperoxidase